MDRAIVSGEPAAQVARRFSLSKDSVARHKSHISPALVRAAIKREERRQERVAVSYLDRIDRLIERTEAILDREEAAGESKVSLLAVRELRGLLDLLGRATGELRDGSAGTTVNIISSPDWLAVRAIIGELLADLAPEKRAMFASRLLELEAPSTTVERVG